MSTGNTTPFDVLTINTLDELTEVVHGVFDASRTKWWFRGHADAGWDLRPKIWRSYDAQTERYLTNLFYQRAKFRHARFPDDNDYAGWLALMQHYGLPTRLLDWSDSVLIAAYFAIKYDRDMSRTGAKQDAAIWMLHPAALNEAQGYEAVFPSLNANSLIPVIQPAFKGVARAAAVDHAASKYDVIAAVPVNHDLRILMQQGAFTVHATPQPLNAYPNCGPWLKKLVIPKSGVARMGLSLDMLGLRLSDVFPDLHHLVIELMNLHRPQAR